MTAYSHSRLSTWENCPRKFAFRYVEKVPVETEGVEAFTGKRVHEILERLYHHVARYGKPPSLKQVIDRFRRDWTAHWHDKIQIVRSELDAAHYAGIGQRCLENYYRGHYPFEDGETVGVEQHLTLRLDDDGRFRVQGIVDRIVRRAQGHYEIHDYKTGGYVPKQADLDRDRQLALYQIGLEQAYDDVERVDLVWHYLARNRTLRSQRSSDQLEALKAETIELIETIEAADDYPATTNALCRWCDYNDRCPAYGGAAAAAPPLDDLADAAAPANAEPHEAPARDASAGTQLSLI